jgi:hypothetical protein
MILIKADKNSEAGVMPDTELLTAMGNFNEELVKAGLMQAGEGLHPSSQGARVRFRVRNAQSFRPVCRHRRADRRLLDLESEIAR